MSYGPIQRPDLDSESFKRRQIDLMTAAIVWIFAIVVVAVIIGGGVAVMLWMFS